MHAVLLIFGVAAAAAGAVMIGLGLWIDLSFGNALLTSGVTALVGGFIVLGLAAAVRELRGLTALLGSWAGEPSSHADAMEMPSVPRPAAPDRMTMPLRPGADLPARASVRPAEPRLAADEAPDTPMGRAPRFGTPLAQRDVPLESMLEAALLPQTPAPAVPEAELGEERREPSLEPAARPQAAAKPAPRVDAPWRPLAAEPVNESGAFDAMWPSRVEPPVVDMRGPASATAAAEPKTEESKGEEPKASERPAGNERRPVAILKSGVVDGMAYTLYTDGSIEAELPEGTIRFASIEELREHLDANE